MVKLRRLFAVLLVVFVLVSVVLAGCGSKPADNGGATEEKKTEEKKEEPKEEAKEETKPAEAAEVKFAYWANAAEQKNFEFASGGIEKVYPEVKVTLQGYPTSDEFWAAIPAAIAAGVGPDVIGFSDEGNAEYMVNGVLEPLDDLLKEVGMDKSKFVPTLLNGWTYEGKLYGIPYDTSTSMLNINVDMWQKAGLGEYPKTMDELKQAAKALTKGDVKGLAIFINEFHLTQYAHAFGGDWGNGKTIDTKENAAGLQFVVDLFKEGLAITPKQLAASWDGEAFAKGKVAISTGGPWYIGYLKEASPDLKHVGIPMPKGTVDAQSAYSHGFSVTKQSKSKLAAMKLIDYMTRDEAQLKGIENVGYVPAVQTLVSEYIKSSPEFMKGVMDNMAKNGKPFAYPPETKNFNADLCSGMEEIIFVKDTKFTVETLLKGLQDKYAPK